MSSKIRLKYIRIFVFVFLIGGISYILYSSKQQEEQDVGGSLASIPEENLIEDSDSDGFSNWLETTIGTDPNDSLDFPEEKEIENPADYASSIKVISDALPPVEKESIAADIITEAYNLSRTPETTNQDFIDAINRIEEKLDEKSSPVPVSATIIIEKSANTTELLRVLDNIGKEVSLILKDNEPEVTLISRILNKDEMARNSLVKWITFYDKSIMKLSETPVVPELAGNHKKLIGRIIVIRNALEDFLLNPQNTVTIQRTLFILLEEVEGGDEYGNGMLRKLFNDLKTSALSI